MKKRMTPGIDPEGTALITVLMMMLALFFLSSIVMDASSTYLNQWVAPQVRTSRALYVAEGGVRLALQWFRNDYWFPRSSYFTATSGQIFYNGQPVVLSKCSSCSDSTSPTNHPDPYQDTEGETRSGAITTFRSNLTNQALGNGSFNVVASLRGLNPQQWQIASTGTVAGVSKNVTVQIRRNPFNPPYALVTEGDLTVSGNSTITGTYGSVHSNEDLAISGNSVFIAVVATSSGSYTGPANPGWEGGQPKVKIPEVEPDAFRQYATYELRLDGNVYCGQAGASVGCIPGALITTGPATEWSYNSGKWTMNSNSATDGAFYIQGNAKVTGNPGNPATPWLATLITTGDIDMAGTPIMSRYTQNLLLVAGRDMVISGNANTTYEGIMAAHEQLKITGNPQLNGLVFSENAENLSSTVLVDEISSVSGTPTITYNGQMGNNPFLGDLAIVSWMEN